jgi:hypothetical protein
VLSIAYSVNHFRPIVSLLLTLVVHCHAHHQIAVHRATTVAGRVRYDQTEEGIIATTYASVAVKYAPRGISLTAVDVRPSALSGVRRIVEVIISFTSRVTDVVEKQFVTVDVHEKFLFLVKPLTFDYDR